LIDQHGAVLFGGNCYSGEWHKIAVEERGLANLKQRPMRYWF
jgi:glutamine synthetase